ncbi:MAG: hypothetical protein AAFP68_15105 [Pseudomonadota bacterium]
MKKFLGNAHLLTLGVAPLLLVVSGIIVLLWAAFFWATAPVGAA